jgi:hypothetical protein
MTKTVSSLDLTEIAALLRATPQILDIELSAVGAEAGRWHPAPGEWCINEVIGHIIEADRHGFAGRIQTIMAQERPQLATWDVPAVAAERHDCEQDPFRLIEELLVMRERSSQMVIGLQPDLLTRSGIHPQVGELRIVDLIHEWIHHDRNHLKQILSNIQAYVWPYMGNAQHFSQIM